MSRFLRTAAALALVAVAIPVARAQTATFDFESVAANTPAPITVTNNGLTATFTGASAAVCDVSSLGFANLRGRALIQGLCVGGPIGPVTVTFSSFVTRLGFAIASPLGSPVQLQTFLGAALVSTFNITLAVPPGGSFPEALFTTAGSATFDRVVFTPVGTVIGLDNITATLAPSTVIPEPSTVVLLASGLAGVAAVGRGRRTAA